MTFQVSTSEKRGVFVFGSSVFGLRFVRTPKNVALIVTEYYIFKHLMENSYFFTILLIIFADFVSKMYFCGHRA